MHNRTDPQTCLQVIPLAEEFLAAKIPYEDMALVLGQVFARCPRDLPPEQFADAIVEYARKRAENGNVTVENLQAQQAGLGAEVNRLHDTRTGLTTEIQQLSAQRLTFQGEINALRVHLATMLTRLEKAQQTDASLTQYQHDKEYLRNVVGFDIANVARSRNFFQEVQRLGYDARMVIGYITNIPPLTQASEMLASRARELTWKVDELRGQVTELDKKRVEAENAKDDAERQAREAKIKADAEVKASEKRITDKLTQEKMTFATIEETTQFRQQLKEAGMDP